MKNIIQLRHSILLVLLLYTTTAISQIHWIDDFKLAKAIALEQKKWIVVDFWASWCGPCKKMDRELWQKTDINTVKDKFVFVKVDFDQQKELVQYFTIQSIPSILVIDPNRAVIDRKIGYINTSEYINWFKKIPETDLKNLYSALTPMLLNRKSSLAYLKLGEAYQNIAIDPANALIKGALVNQSNLQFKMVLKKSKNKSLIYQAQLYKLLNKAIAGKSKSVLKKLNQKTPVDETPELVELKHFIRGYCYLKVGNTKALSIEKQEIKNPDWLAMLGNIPN